MTAPATNLDLVTGASSNAGAAIARRLLEQGREVRTLTFHPDRAHPLRCRVQALPYQFDDPVALARSLEGVTTLYNSYWVRFDHRRVTFEGAVANSLTLFRAARRAGVARIVHLSVSNPSLDSPLRYFRGKALVEQALADVGVRYSIVRPTWILGGEREVLANNIAWILRHFPVFALPGTGRYPVQPVYIDDVASICEDVAHAEGDPTVDAAGPERMSFEVLVRAIGQAVGARSRIVHLPPPAMTAVSRALGLVMRDVVLTREEIDGLTAGLLVSSEEPRGRTRFSDWLAEHGASLGRDYTHELRRRLARA
jgi:uncharacterized protein YbjT (DUF2867 family)